LFSSSFFFFLFYFSHGANPPARRQAGMNSDLRKELKDLKARPAPVISSPRPRVLLYG
jgi:hypothetical protein